MIDKQIYQTPSIQRMGSFEALTHGQSTGLRFDGTFIAGQPIPVDSDGNPLAFS